MLYKHINLEYLFSASKNIKFILNIFAVYRLEVPKIEANMRAALADSNWEELEKIAHKAKSSTGVVGCKSLVQMANDIEKLAVENTEIATLAEKCEAFILSTKESLIELDDAELQILNE